MTHISMREANGLPAAAVCVGADDVAQLHLNRLPCCPISYGLRELAICATALMRSQNCTGTCQGYDAKPEWR